MFKVTTVHDTIRIPPPLLGLPTKQALELEIDAKYPNRVLLDVGLVICRYTRTEVKVQPGACVAGDAGAHVACSFQLLVFGPRPEQVCVGTITSQSAHGVYVRVGEFFDSVYIPAYWMLNPSHYEAETGMWIWAPVYEKEEGEEEEGETKETTDAAVGDTAPKTAHDTIVKQEDADAETPEPARYEMHVGAQIRFRVKSIQYTQTTHTAKGVQSTTTSASRKRSTSIGYADDTTGSSNGTTGSPTSGSRPPAMQIVASICEDGLGLTEWWAGPVDDDDAAEEVLDGKDNGDQGAGALVGNHVKMEVDEDIKPDISLQNGSR